MTGTNVPTTAEIALTIATRAAEMSLQLASVLHRENLLPREESAELAKSMRDIAKLYEQAGDDGFAAAYWSIARVLDPSGSSRGS